MNRTILDVKNLKVDFHTSNGIVRAVRGVSFHLDEGEILGIVGESGSGKSVMSMSLVRLLPDTAEIDAKSISLEGREISKLSGRALRRVRGKDIAIVFQDPMSSLNPLMKVGAQVAEMILEHRRVPKDALKKEVIELFRRVRIPEPEKRYSAYPHELSGGMRQRVMLAIALALKPSVLIADEPTTALDVTIQDQILKVIRELKQTFSTSIIFITHDLAVVAELCDRVLVMYGGQVMEEAPVDDLFEKPLHPYTLGLMASMPSLEQDREERLVPIAGSPPDMLSPPPGCPFAPRCSEAREICLTPPPFVELGENRRSRCWLLSKDACDAGVSHPFKEMTNALYGAGSASEGVFCV